MTLFNTVACVPLAACSEPAVQQQRKLCTDLIVNEFKQSITFIGCLILNTPSVIVQLID